MVAGSAGSVEPIRMPARRGGHWGKMSADNRGEHSAGLYPILRLGFSEYTFNSKLFSKRYPSRQIDP